MLEFFNKDKNCFQKDNQKGHFTGSAWVVSPDRSQVLMTNHKKLNMWLQLGGHADGTEDLISVAIREAKEESGFNEFVLLSDRIFDLEIHEVPAIADEPVHYHYDVRFLLEADPKNNTIVVSDESPTDHVQIEQAIQRVKKAAAPIYILGREAIFGYPYARIRWKDPVYGLNHWVRIDRGPETAFPECLQYDGMHARWDAFSSGFGPYAHVRLAKHSGGIFFMLPGEEEQLDGAGANEARRFAALAMKEYEPLLLARRDYAQQVSSRPFRVVISNIIARLNPNDYPLIPSHDPKLNIQQHHYSIEAAEFRRQAVEAGQRAFRAMGLLSEAIAILDKNESLRAGENSQRWRANFDLIRSQCYAYRVRLFQFLLVLDKHAVEFPPPKQPKSNRWHFNRSRKMITPDDGQYKRVQVQLKLKAKRESFLAEMKDQQNRATQLFELVLAEHPGTPWARRARWELDHGYGMAIREGFHDPRYRDVGKRIKVPKF